MINKSSLPPFVKFLTHNCDSWIIGGACLEENPKDFDIFVPLKNWEIACNFLHDKDVTINSLGGIKYFDSYSNKNVDIWTGNMENFLSSDLFKIAIHLKSGNIIKNIKYD